MEILRSTHNTFCKFRKWMALLKNTIYVLFRIKNAWSTNFKMSETNGYHTIYQEDQLKLLKKPNFNCLKQRGRSRESLAHQHLKEFDSMSQLWNVIFDASCTRYNLWCLTCDESNLILMPLLLALNFRFLKVAKFNFWNLQ